MVLQRLLISAALLAAMIGVGATPASSAATPVTDKTQVVSAIITMFDAAKTDDFAKFHTVATPDFYAFDEGKRYDGDQLMQTVKSLHAQGYVFKWSVTRPDVHIHGDIAWITYVNVGSIRDKSGNKPMTWLESAVLQKENGHWRIRFFHSTEVPDATK